MRNKMIFWMTLGIIALLILGSTPVMAEGPQPTAEIETNVYDPLIPVDTNAPEYPSVTPSQDAAINKEASITTRASLLQAWNSTILKASANEVLLDGWSDAGLGNNMDVIEVKMWLWKWNFGTSEWELHSDYRKAESNKDLVQLTVRPWVGAGTWTVTSRHYARKGLSTDTQYDTNNSIVTTP